MQLPISLLVLTLCNCTVTRNVGVEAIRTLAPRQQGAVVTASTGSRFKTRIDPLSRLRVVLRGGGKSRSFPAWDARVSDDGLYAIERTRLGDVRRATVRGLSASQLEALKLAQPKGGFLEQTGSSSASLEGPIRPWLSSFVSAMDLRRCPSGPCTMRFRIGDLSVGEWSFKVNGEWETSDLGVALDVGFEELVGWEWADIDHFEVKFVSGPRTLAGVVSTAAIGVVLAPFALIGTGSRGSRKRGGRGRGRSRGHGSSGTKSGGSGAGLVVDGLSGGFSGGSSAPSKDDKGAGPSLRPEASKPAALWSTKAKVASIVRGVGAVDVSATAGGRGRISTGVALSVRLVNMIELGGGVRVGRNHPTAGFFRGTTVYPLDARHRYAITLGGEIGGSAAGKTGRLSTGFRFSGDHWFAEVMSVSASYVEGSDDASGWRTALGSSIGVVLP